MAEVLAPFLQGSHNAAPSASSSLSPQVDDRTLTGETLRVIMGPSPLEGGFRNEEPATTFMHMWKGG